MKLSTDLNRNLAILVLRSILCSHDKIASILHCAKSTVGDVEKWFQELRYEEAISFCYDQAIKAAVLLEIGKSEEIDSKTAMSAIQVTADYIFLHYGKTHKSKPEQSSLAPSSQQHHARLTDAAEKLRLNVKRVKKAKVAVIGNITQGYIQTSKATEHRQSLENVDRLDADCLLAHLKAMYSEFEEIENWESLNTRESIRQISEDMLQKLKEVSHGIAIKGTCKICDSWK